MWHSLETHTSPSTCATASATVGHGEASDLGSQSVSLTFLALRPGEVGMLTRCSSVCSLQLHNLRNTLEEPREAEGLLPPWVQGPGSLPDASSGRRNRCDGLVQTDKDFLMYPKHQIHIQSSLSAQLDSHRGLSAELSQSEPLLCSQIFVFYAEFPRVFIWVYHPHRDQ